MIAAVAKEMAKHIQIQAAVRRRETLRFNYIERIYNLLRDMGQSCMFFPEKKNVGLSCTESRTFHAYSNTPTTGRHLSRLGACMGCTCGGAQNASGKLISRGPGKKTQAMFSSLGWFGMRLIA